MTSAQAFVGPIPWGLCTREGGSSPKVRVPSIPLLIPLLGMVPVGGLQVSQSSGPMLCVTKATPAPPGTREEGSADRAGFCALTFQRDLG